MYLIAGLGNPEKDYSHTRHNMGFDVINKIAQQYEIEITRTKFNALYGMGMIEDKKVILVKPQTYMNLSGEAIKEFVDFYKLSIEKELLVILDDIDTEPGTIRIRKKGGPGTHNGLKSVVHELADENFARIRVGIGLPKEADMITHVVGPIEQEEYKILEQGIEKASKATTEILKNGIDLAMNKYN